MGNFFELSYFILPDYIADTTEVATNVGNFLKSPIISQKRDILNLILSDCKTDGKNLCFSITNPLDKLLKTPEINKWCDRKESNFHGFLHSDLNAARLPIPPRPHEPF